MNRSGKVNICVVSLSKDDSNIVRNLLRFKNEIHDRIHLEVKSIDNLHEESFDVIILSLLVEDHTELECVTENNLNVVLTSSRCVPIHVLIKNFILDNYVFVTILFSSRHCLWMVGEYDILVASGGIWSELIYDAKRRLCVQKVDRNKVAEMTKQLETNDKHHYSDSNSTHMVSLKYK